MLQTVTHTSHQDKLHLYPFPGSRIMWAGKVWFPMDQTSFLLLLRKLSGEFRLKIYWKCAELNSLLFRWFSFICDKSVTVNIKKTKLGPHYKFMGLRWLPLLSVPPKYDLAPLWFVMVQFSCDTLEKQTQLLSISKCTFHVKKKLIMVI